MYGQTTFSLRSTEQTKKLKVSSTGEIMLKLKVSSKRELFLSNSKFPVQGKVLLKLKVSSTREREKLFFQKQAVQNDVLATNFFCLILTCMKPMYSNRQAREFIIIQIILCIQWLMRHKNFGASHLNSTCNKIQQKFWR